MEAAELLGISERTFRRWRHCYEEAAEAGPLDRRLGQALGQMGAIGSGAGGRDFVSRTRYSGFTARHFHEHLVGEHGFSWGYTWTKSFLQSKGLLARAPRRGAHRRKRPRRPLPGMMLHQDGSRHEWLMARRRTRPDRDDGRCDEHGLFGLPDGGGSTASTFRALSEVFSTRGLPLSLYTDRGSHHFRDPGSGRVGRSQAPDPGRPGAGASGGGAYRGVFASGTWPIGADVPNLAGSAGEGTGLAGITTMAAANMFLREVYLPAHNQRFAVKAEQEGSAFVAIPGVDLNEILVHPGGSSGRQRQYGDVPSPAAARSAQPVACALCQSACAGQALS